MGCNMILWDVGKPRCFFITDMYVPRGLGQWGQFRISRLQIQSRTEELGIFTKIGVRPKMPRACFILLFCTWRRARD